MSEQVEEQEITLDEAAVATIVEKTKEAAVAEVKEGIDKTVDTKVKEAVEASTKDILDEHIKNVEEIERKAVEKAQKQEIEDNPVAKALADGKFTEEIAKMSPAMRFYRATRALENENMTELRELNSFALASQLKARKEVEAKGGDALAKTGYANETTAADGAVLIPDAEFVTTVFDNLPSFGVAFQYADVRQTDRTSVRVLSLDSGLTFYSTAEAGVKTGAKLAFAKTEVTLQKYAVIVPATDELSDDAAIDY